VSKADQDLIVKTAKEAEDWANNKIKTGEAAILVDLQRKGMQVVIPDAESFRVKAKPAVEALFQKEWSVTTWQEVLAQ
jgi:TRAP-type C4-dicarboxylate transport system substrate-binding protein